MSQKFGLIDPNKVIGACSADINEALMALVSSFSGTEFPTNVWLGMFCYRTDEVKLYQLRSINPNSWVLVADLSRSATDAITAERLAVARRINGVVFDGTRDIVLDTARSFTAPRTAAGSVDFKSLLTDGTYAELLSGTNPNGPAESDLFYVNVYVSGGNVTQMALGYKNNSIYVRNRNANAWSRWERFVKFGEKLPADGGNSDTVDGKHANNTANNIATKDKDDYLSAKSLKSAESNVDNIAGAIAFRVSADDNSLKFCSNKSAIKDWLNFIGFDDSVQVAASTIKNSVLYFAGAVSTAYDKENPVNCTNNGWGRQCVPYPNTRTLFGIVNNIATGNYPLKLILQKLVANSHTHDLTLDHYDCNCACDCSDCSSGNDGGG